MLVEEGPGQSNMASRCWRLPLIQKLIGKRFEVFCNISNIAQPLKQHPASAAEVCQDAD
jgi:hypothetical protein